MSQRMADRDLQGEIPRGEDVGMAEREEKEAFGRPGADARQLHERRDRLARRRPRQRVHIERAGGRRRADRQERALLGAGKAGRAHLGIAERQDRGGIVEIGQRRKPAQNRRRAGARHLLPDHRADQPAKTRRRDAKRKRARLRRDGVEAWVEREERGDFAGDVRLGSDHRRACSLRPFAPGPGSGKHGAMTSRDPPVFRFAPSPNGELHLGHALSALTNQAMARASGGRFLLRLEDIDPERCRPELERGILADLAFLGIEWDGEPRRQSEHFDRYREALDRLAQEGLIYPAFLSRGEIRARAERAEAETGRLWSRDPDGAPLYPGDDRALSTSERAARIAAGDAHVVRLDMAAALSRAGPLGFTETGTGPAGETGRLAADPGAWGDVVLARKGLPTSYHLAVTVDDALQGVTHVVRGQDLFAATSVHRLLQALLGLPEPVYHHHRLVLGDDGRKLSKSRGDVSLRALREAGETAESIRARLGLSLTNSSRGKPARS